MTGLLKNYNTIEEFKAVDKTALFNQLADDIWKSIVEDKSTALLNRFLVITFADLKKYKYFYWFAFPTFPQSRHGRLAASGPGKHMVRHMLCHLTLI